MHDNDQIPQFNELIKDLPKKYYFLFLLVAIIIVAGLFWTVAIL